MAAMSNYDYYYNNNFEGIYLNIVCLIRLKGILRQNLTNQLHCVEYS